jgi:hypothetical protein
MAALKTRSRGSVLTFQHFIYTTGMARPLRLEYASALYHITARGDRREDIFFREEDRTEFLVHGTELWVDSFPPLWGKVRMGGIMRGLASVVAHKCLYLS